jgi:transcriptional regulator with XRE-family HTH domain
MILPLDEITLHQMPRSKKKNQFSQIGQNIKTVRDKKFQWSPEDFADKMDVTVRTVHNWENGKTDLPHSRLAQAANIFKMTISDLETTHERPFVNIQAQHDNQVIYNNGIVHSDKEILAEYTQDLKNQNAKKDEQLAQKDIRIANLEKRLDDLMDKMVKNS